MCIICTNLVIFFRLPEGHPKIGPTASDEALVHYWSEGTSVSMKLMLFNVLFLDVVAHPSGKSLQDVKQTYRTILSLLSLRANNL